MRYDIAERARAREVITNRVDKLEAFGSADQIRDYFVQERIFGMRCKRNSCVVARYLSREIEAELGGRWVTSVDGAQIGLDSDEDGFCSLWEKRTPRPLAALASAAAIEPAKETIRFSISTNVPDSGRSDQRVSAVT